MIVLQQSRFQEEPFFLPRNPLIIQQTRNEPYKNPFSGRVSRRISRLAFLSATGFVFVFVSGSVVLPGFSFSLFVRS